MTPATVYLVGAGPGDPGLVTVRGADLLKRADAVIYDYLASPQLLQLAPEGAQLVYVGKKGFQQHVTQDQVNRIIVDCARGLARNADETPATVVRLKGGDPFVFGRGGEEALALAEAGIPFEVVPGVTSGVAAPAYAGIPVTHRGVSSSVTFVTGNEDPTKPDSALDWNALAALVQRGSTVCFYMGMRNLETICQKLTCQGCDAHTPVALVQQGTTPQQRTLVATLATASRLGTEQGFSAPVMIVVGPVAQLHEQISVRPHGPLAGKRVLVTRSEAQSGMLAERLRAQGAEAVEFPTISICDPDDGYQALDAALATFSQFAWVIFTSANGVERFFDRLAASALPHRDARAFAGKRIAAIGPATARALAARGLQADAVPAEYRAEALFQVLVDAGLQPGERILLPRAQVARESLPQMLREHGAHVTVAPAYATRMPEAASARRLASLLEGDGIDAITFTSSSTAANFCRATGALGSEAANAIASARVFSIGPITTATLAEHGLDPTATATEYTIDGLVRAMIEVYRE